MGTGTGIRIHKLWVSNEEFRRDNDVGGSKLRRIAVGCKLGVTDVGVSFVENGEDDGDLGTRVGCPQVFFCKNADQVSADLGM